LWWCEPGAEPGRLVVTRGLPAQADIDVLFSNADAAGDGLFDGPSTSSAAGAG
jgi:hypothetical protein